MKRRAGSRKQSAGSAASWLLVLAVPLLFAGCHEQQSEPPVARVDGIAIPQGTVREELRAVLWRRGETWDALDEATRKGHRQAAIDRCVEELLLRSFAKQPAGLSAVQSQQSEDAFQQFLKQFEPPEGWKPRLEWQGLSEVEMRERITAEVMQGNAVEDWLRQQRTGSREQRETEAVAWFEANREKLRVPESVKVSHVFLTGHDRAKPDRSAEIAELHRRLTAGETTFEALAAKFSEDERSKKTGGSLGWISRDRVPVEFAEKVFALPVGKLSAPFQSRLGWHIAVVHEKRPPRLPEFAEVKVEITAMIDSQWREAAVKRLVQELRAKAKIEVHDAVLRALEPAP